MYQIVKSIFAIALLSVFFSIITNYIVPDPFYGAVGSTITYFLNTMNTLASVIHVSVLFSCIHLIANFTYGLVVFLIYFWIIKILV